MSEAEEDQIDVESLNIEDNEVQMPDLNQKGMRCTQCTLHTCLTRSLA